MSDQAWSPAADQTLVGISFGDPFRANELLSAVTRLAALGHLKLVDAVFVTSDDTGKTAVRETIDPTPGRSAMSGALWAGLFGLLLGGPVGWIVGAGVGAGAGVVSAKLIDHGIPDEWVAWFREAVQPNATILALLVEDLDRGALVEELQRFGGAQLVYANLDPAWVARIEAAIGESATKREQAEPGSGPPSGPES